MRLLTPEGKGSLVNRPLCTSPQEKNPRAVSWIQTGHLHGAIRHTKQWGYFISLNSLSSI